MKSKKFRMLILLLCVLLCACGSTSAEAPAEPPVQESSSQPESSAEEPTVEEPVIEEDRLTLPENWYAFSPTPEDIITFRFVDFKDDPVSGLYIDIIPRIILEPGEKRPDIGSDPVLTGQTDQNGEIVWRDYFPCREGEEYLLTVTSATIGNQNYTNTSSHVLPDLSKLEGSYTAEYLWEQIYDSSTVEHQFWKTLEGYWNGPKNRFVIFDFNEKGQPIFCSGLYDADGGRGYGTVTGITQNTDGSVIIEVYYPEHPESVLLSYLPAETITVTINSLANDNMNLQYSDYNASSFYRAGSTFCNHCGHGL